MLTRSRTRLTLVACVASAALLAVFATTATATATPVGALPAGPTSTILVTIMPGR